MDNQWLIVGLGNPDENYANTRHNIGFMAVDFWQAELDSKASFKNFVRHKKNLALKQSFLWEGQRILLAKPMTYMNVSGEAIKALIEDIHLSLSRLLVIQDDVDQPFGQIRFHYQRGHGGHNGIRHIHHCLGRDDYCRLKLGIGRPQRIGHYPSSDPVSRFVLSPFSKEEQKNLKAFLELALEAIQCFILEGQEVAGNTFNRRSLFL